MGLRTDRTPRRTAALVVAAAARVVVAAAAVGCERAPPPVAGPPVPPPPAAPRRAETPDLPPEADFLAQVDRSRGTRDCFTVLRDPPLVPADRAPRMRDDETVLALDLGDAQVCYPVQYLNHHEIVEHRMAGLDLLACW